MTNSTVGTYALRVITEDGELLMEDTDFTEAGVWDHFDEAIKMGNPGDTVQICLVTDWSVVAEKHIPHPM